jgi:hypothetical protein
MVSPGHVQKKLHSMFDSGVVSGMARKVEHIKISLCDLLISHGCMNRKIQGIEIIEVMWLYEVLACKH